MLAPDSVPPLLQRVSLPLVCHVSQRHEAPPRRHACNVQLCSEMRDLPWLLRREALPSGANSSDDDLPRRTDALLVDFAPCRGDFNALIDRNPLVETLLCRLYYQSLVAQQPLHSNMTSLGFLRFESCSRAVLSVLHQPSSDTEVRLG